jgi:hypothetical protein
LKLGRDLANTQRERLITGDAVLSLAVSLDQCCV